MAECDQCGAVVGAVLEHEAATLDKHGSPQHGYLCRNCWPGEWPLDGPSGADRPGNNRSERDDG